MSFERHDGPNIGSIAKLWIRLLEDVSDTFHTPDNSLITQTIAGNWRPIEIVPGDASYQEAQENTEQGPIFSFSVQFTIHSDRAALTAAIESFVNRKLLVAVQDRNEGLIRLLGEKSLFEYHARMSYSHVKERKPGRNAYDFTISCQMSHPATYYEGTITEA